MSTSDTSLGVINSMSESIMEGLKDSSGKIPSLANQLIMTDEDDIITNLDGRLVIDTLWTGDKTTTGAVNLSANISDYELFVFNLNETAVNEAFTIVVSIDTINYAYTKNIDFVTSVPNNSVNKYITYKKTGDATFTIQAISNMRLVSIKGIKRDVSVVGIAGAGGTWGKKYSYVEDQHLSFSGDYSGYTFFQKTFDKVFDETTLVFTVNTCMYVNSGTGLILFELDGVDLGKYIRCNASSSSYPRGVGMVVPVGNISKGTHTIKYTIFTDGSGRTATKPAYNSCISSITEV